MEYILLALFSAGALIPIIFIVYIFISVSAGGYVETLLCMECDQCIKVCPAVRKNPKAASPKEILQAIKAGNLDELIAEGKIECNECGACGLVCPRGLSPCKELIRYKTKKLKKIKKELYEDIEIETVPIQYKN